MSDSAASAKPTISAAGGWMRPAGIGRVAVRAIWASMSRSYQWLTAPAPPADRYPPMHVATISQIDRVPARSIVVTVVSSSSDWTLGLVSASRSAATWRTPEAGSTGAVAGDASMAE